MHNLTINQDHLWVISINQHRLWPPQDEVFLYILLASGPSGVSCLFISVYRVTQNTHVSLANLDIKPINSLGTVCQSLLVSVVDIIDIESSESQARNLTPMSLCTELPPHYNDYWPPWGKMKWNNPVKLGDKRCGALMDNKREVKLFTSLSFILTLINQSYGEQKKELQTRYFAFKMKWIGL